MNELERGGKKKITPIQVEFPLSKMLATRIVLDFGLFGILEYLHNTYWLNILIQKYEI